MTTARLKNSAIVGSMAAAMVLFGAAITAAQAKTVKIELVAKETTVPLDNQGNTVAAWTFNGQVPGPVIRATEGDTIEFTLKNDAANKKSHALRALGCSDEFCIDQTRRDQDLFVRSGTPRCVFLSLRI